jgi:5'-3' exonuclease
MLVHLVDGTYELFRHHFALPSHITVDGMEVAAARGVLSSMIGMLEEGATHIGIATDRTVESFRNELYEGYKTGEDLDPELGNQFPLLDDLLRASGFTVFSMIEHEADDGMGAAAAIAAAVLAAAPLAAAPLAAAAFAAAAFAAAALVAATLADAVLAAAALAAAALAYWATRN